MSDIAIRVENLSKRYRIGGRQKRYKRFTETVMDTLSAPIRRLRNLGKPTPPEEIIWALKDVSFEVERGEVLGIIGRNGAGKTTLLKILSRITEPTEGRAEIHGRVGSLLEVGTGFHPELTGRENVYLNGAILGMRRAEIDAKFDEIVEFSGVEKFLDTPVKRYSSGMRVRLAFSVAAHLEPEIMLIDEVLAVGDAAFQKKCLGKMGEVAQEGRTVLFVSHNMGAVKNLCSIGLLVSNGKLLEKGSVEDVVNAYMIDYQPSETSFPVIAEDIVIKGFEICQKNKKVDHIDGMLGFQVHMAFEALRSLDSFRIGVYVKTAVGDTLCRSFIADWDPSLENIRAGDYQAWLTIPGRFLAPGSYIVHLHASRYGVVDYISRHSIDKMITVSALMNFNQAHPGEPIKFPVLLRNEWEVNRL